MLINDIEVFCYILEPLLLLTLLFGGIWRAGRKCVRAGIHKSLTYEWDCGSLDYGLLSASPTLMCLVFVGENHSRAERRLQHGWSITGNPIKFVKNMHLVFKNDHFKSLQSLICLQGNVVARAVIEFCDHGPPVSFLLLLLPSVLYILKLSIYFVDFYTNCPISTTMRIMLVM